jgi:alpha-galactosidase
MSSVQLRALSLLGVTISIATFASCQSWSVGNERIERTLTFVAGHGLRTSRLSNLDTRFDFIRGDEAGNTFASEFSLQCEGKTVSGSNGNLQLVGAVERVLLDGKSLTVTLRRPDMPLLIDVVYRVYDHQPASRKWLMLHNTGDRVLHISHLKIESIAPSVGPSSEMVLNAQYGTIPRELLYTGRSEDAGLLISNSRTGDGFAVLNEVPGYMKRTEVDGFYHPGHAVLNAMYDTDLMPFARSLAPGETFQTAAVSLVLYRSGAGLFDPRWELPTYTQAVLQRRVSAKGAPWIYNTWDPFKRNIDAGTSLALIDVASAMGLDIFTIDDGWAQEYGDNTVNLTAFPQGLEPIRKAVETKGMRLGLWIPLATIGKDTADFRNHPEWAALDPEGRPKETDTAAGSKVVMCLAGPFQDSAAARVNDAIERFHLAYVKLDLTTVFNAYGEAPGCWPKDHNYAGWVESLGRIYEGIRNVTAQVYAKHPDVLLDLTFELWGQKHLIDAGLLAAGDLDWLSNVDDSKPYSAGPRQARALLYARAASMPAEAMLIGNMQAEVPAADEIFATEAGAAPVMLGDLRKLTQAQRIWYRDHIHWFKQLRAKVDLGESFFPLGDWQQPTAEAWDGYARLAKTGDGIIALFRNDSGVDAATVKLPLMPQGRFFLHSAMTQKDLGAFTQQDFTTGVKVPFGTDQKVEMIEIQHIP